MPDYEKDMQIDEMALDVEWLEQPQLMIKYARVSVELNEEAEKTKQRRDIVRAELDKDIRLDPGMFGIEKITETVVANTILSHGKYQRAEDEYIKTQSEAAMAKLAIQAVQQRKSALENLVQLFGLQYFAGPKIPRNLSKERSKREQEQKEADKKVAGAMKRGKKK